MKKNIIIAHKLLIFLATISIGSGSFVIAQQLEKPAYATPTFQVFLEYMAFNIPIILITSIIGIVVSFFSKNRNWGVGSGIAISLFLYLGRKDIYIYNDGGGMGIGALIAEIMTIALTIYFVSKRNIHVK